MDSNADKLTSDGVGAEDLFSALWAIRNIFIDATLTHNMSRAATKNRQLSWHPEAYWTLQDLSDLQLKVTHV